uniref:G_PROTEIN_RECEP_F1_2 domain-containing protein n=1 Tax=Wuchereria bancrofti TaxID=6293 RepID=A0A1I8ERG9_WUCBA
YEKVCRVERGCSCTIFISEPKCCCVGQSVSEIPGNLTDNVRRLLLYNVGISHIRENAFSRYQHLEEIVIEDSDALQSINADAFGNLYNLGKLCTCRMIYKRNKLFDYLSVSGCKNLKEMTPRHRLAMEVIDFSHNHIEYLGDGQLRAVHANKIRLNNNNLREIGSHIFANCRFSLLELNNNLELKRLSIDTFAGISFIKLLDLSRTGITELPTTGLSRLEGLKLKDTEDLKKLPPILAFTSLKKVEFTYPYHCCLFKYASKEISTAGEMYTKNLEEIRNRECSAKATPKLNRLRRQSARTDRPQESRENPLDFSDLLQWFDSVNAGNITIEIDDDWDTLLEPEFEDADVGLLTTFNCTSSAVSDFFASIQCTPMPNALNPCEDVIGYDFLRWAIWFVWISAIVGNVGVWIVLCQMGQKKMQVHYFFMANLSTADLLTGVYLGVLAIADYKTSNEYYNYAVAWQTGIGCNIAGFISVFGSEISIMSMFLIAFDMCYNIRNAFYGKHLRMRTAIMMMAVAYMIAFTMAVLPIIGVSTYTSTSVCLPLSIEDNFDRIYVIGSLLFNLLAFLGMAISYSFIVRMLCDPEQPKRSEDKAIILKMATLIGTEMLCWFPTLFFGLTAALGHPLISISVAKIFLVIFYPINAFTNPFLYVFLTKITHIRPCWISLLSSKTPNDSNELKSLPSSTFQKETSAHAGAQSEKRPLIFNERLRVSAAPRMSDISEHVVMEKNITPNLLSHKASSFQQQQLPTERQDCVVLPKQLQNRRSSVRSTGKDSGCGSLTPPIPSYRFQCFPTESST